MKTVLVVLAIAAAGAGRAEAETRETAPAPPTARSAAQSSSTSAYYEFLLGRQLEQNDDLDGALAAFQRAAKVDPGSAEILNEIASIYARQNHPKEAIAAAEQALKNDPGNRAANRVLGGIYASLAQAVRPGVGGDRENAERAIGYLEKSDPEDAPGVQLLLGRMYLRIRAWDKAIALFSKLVADEPGVNEAVASLVQAYQGAGRNADAIEFLEANAGNSAQLSILLAELYEGEQRWMQAADAYGRAAQRRSRDLDLKIRWATALLTTGRPEALTKARSVLKDVAAADPSQVRALYLLVQADRQVSEGAEAEAIAMKMVAADPKGVWGQYALAQVASDKKDYRKVIETLEPVVAGWSSRSDSGQGLNVRRLYEQLGQAYLGLKQYDQAVEQFQHARDIAPGDVGIARLQAQALRESGQLDRAVGVLEDLLKNPGAQPPAYFALAELYVDAGKIPQALGVLDRAAEKIPGDTSVAFELGAVLERQKRHGEAERLFRRVLASNPNHAQALNYLGYMLADRGERLQESVGYIKRALAIEPDNPAYLDSLGWAYFKLNQLDLAEVQLRKAAANLVTNSVIQDHLGDTLYKLGNFDEAAAVWQRALEGDGDSIERSVIERKIKAARDKTKRK